MVLSLNNIFQRKIPRIITTFIWDVDGTLYQTTDEIFDQMKKITVDYVVEKTLEEKRVVKNYINKQVGHNRLLGDIVEEDYKLDKHFLAKLAEDRIDKSVFVDKDELLVNLFDNQLRKFKHVVLTNGSLQNTKKILEKIGFNKSHFASIHSREDLGKNIKPSKRAFFKVIESINTEPGEAMMIGDTLTQDIFPAKELGMTTCFIADDKTINIKEADFIIENPGEIINII